MHDWYVAFRADYVSGIPCSDGDENSEVIWVDVEEALHREDVPGLTKEMIMSAVTDKKGLEKIEYDSKSYPPYSLYSLR